MYRNIVIILGSSNNIEPTREEFNYMRFKHRWSHGGNQFPWPSYHLYRFKLLRTLTST